MTTEMTIDPARVQAFAGKVLGDTTSFTAIVMAAIGDELGLFKNLAAHGPATATQLAQRSNIDARYAREWLSAMASAGYLEYDPSSDSFSLPAEHIPVLAHESGPAFFGGILQFLIGVVEPIDQLIEAFRHGGGVPQSAFPDRMYAGNERFTGSWFENYLLQEWLPALPNLQDRLERGCDVADIGCGRGRALIKLAQAYPRSRFTGYDMYGPNIARAIRNAERAGVADRVTFQELDVTDGLPQQFDLITTFDVVHDAVDPLGLLSAIREALRPNGTYLCLDINCADSLEENLNPMGTFIYGCSVLYCMTTSLADGGAGLGTAGLPEIKLHELARQAGFSSSRRLPLENPFNTLYELKP